MTEKFRTAFVLMKTNHDLTSLESIADNIKFITSGYEKENGIKQSITEGLLNFDPLRDIIVPIGRSITCVLLGICLREFFDVTSINFAIYRGSGQYEVYEL